MSTPPCRFAINAIAKSIFIIMLTYISLAIISIAMSMYIVDLAVYAKLNKRIHESNCNMDYVRRDANPLKIWEFYTHLEYWLAEHRASVEFLKNERCLSVMLTTLHDIKRPASIVFVNNEGNVQFMLQARF